MKIEGNQIKVGNIIMLSNKLWKVTKTQHTQPGKGGAYLQAELKNIKDGSKSNERFRSSESIEKIRLDEKKFQYLYSDEKNMHFMDTQTYEQINIDKKILDENKFKFLQNNMNVIIEYYEDTPISIILSENIILKVIEADPVTKGQTASSSYKNALLENDYKVLVPPHIKIGDKIVISTSDGSYIEKSKE